MSKKQSLRKVELPAMNRAAKIQPDSINEENRTVEVIFTKGARVLRRGFFETFFEELGLEKDNVRMERLKSGNAPVLDNHGFTERSGIASTLGVVEKAEIRNGEGVATLRFSQRDDVTDIFRDIKDGIIRNISIGYTVFRVEKVEEENDVPVYRAVDWEPFEISVVPAGADADAVIRSKDAPLNDCFLVGETEETRENPDKPIDNKNNELENSKQLQDNELDHRGHKMTEKEMQEQIEKARQEERAKALAEGQSLGAEKENERQVEIRSIVKKVGLEDSLAETYITEKKSVDEVRTLVIEALAKKDEEPDNSTRSTNTQVSVGTDHARQARVDGMTSALLHRFRPKDTETIHNGQRMKLPGYELNEAGRSYAYFSLIDMARACLEGHNIRTGMMPKHELADMVLGNKRGLHSISDFPEILANVANKTLRGGYQAAPQTWRPFTREVFVSDFKEISRTNLGDAPKLEKLEEGSEVKRGTISEAAEKYRVEEFAKIVAISRKVIINDDLAAFTQVPERMGRRAADLESDTVWGIIKDNALLATGNALFSAAHNNLSLTPAAPGEAGLSEGRKSMRRQLGLDGAEISLTPVWMYVPPEHETAAEKLIASIVPDSSTNVSPFSSAGRTPLRLDVEPRLETGPNGSTDAWYLMADLGQVDMLEIAFLEGTDGPQLQTRDGFDVHGMEIKIMHDLGAKAIDFRGLFKNAGA